MIFGYISMAVLPSSCNGVPMSIVNHRSSGGCKALSTVGFPKPPVSQPNGRVHPQAHILAVIASEDADNEIHKVVTVGGYVVDVVAEAFGTPAGVTALPGYETACCVLGLRCVGHRY
jgi:hypothetical protein